MTDTLTEPLPPLRPAQKSAAIETDIFCLECGYNLHAQPVTRDERLGIFVCRCPECGRFHPAGDNVTATKVWLSRLATYLLVLWVFIVVVATVWIVIGLGAIPIAHVESFSYRKLVTNDGQEAVWATIPAPGGMGGSSYQVVQKGTTQPAIGWKMIYTLEPPAADSGMNPYPSYYNNSPQVETQRWWQMVLLIIAGAAMGFVTGMLLVVFLWHWKKRRYAFVMLLPFAVAGFIVMVDSFNDEYAPILTHAIQITLMYAALEAAFLGLGIKAGRPIVRGILRMIVPSRPRQHFNFLWHADGKTPPPASIIRAPSASATTPA